MNLFIVQAKLKGLDIRARIDPLIPNECYTDSYRIQKIIINLLANAVKYTNKGFIELCAINTGISIDISVKDTGIGIKQERLNNIFDIFSDTGNGMSGLGLHISNNILKFFGASIKVSSKEGHGSKFSFFLDILENTPKFEYSKEIDIPKEVCNTIDMPQMLFSIFDKQNPKVLIADDNDFNRMLLGNLLTNHGIKYTEAINGKMAVQIVKSFDKKNSPILCIIMDCDMPIMDG